jgi:exosortase H (IPTLxxWG-CTERM-specific)
MQGMKLRVMWRRPEVRFLIVFVIILSAAFTTVALRPVNDAVVVPYTRWVATVSGHLLGLFGEKISINGCSLSSPRFSVTIYNGCNGLIATLILLSGVLAFPARWTGKMIGVIGGILAIQIINLVRIVSLFYIGVFVPKLFNQAHIYIWQSIVILASVALWIAWARHFGAVPSGNE